MVRKNTVKRNPIGSNSEALERQRTRQSLRRHIVDIQCHGLTMNTDNLLQYNPKLADVGHSTRVAYAKFMTVKIKKEIKFEDEQQIKVENARGAKALMKFKSNAGILKKTVQMTENETIVPNGIKSAEVKQVPAYPPASPTNIDVPTVDQTEDSDAKDFRSRTPIEEENEDVCSPPDRPSTPADSILDDPVPSVSVTPIPKSPMKETPSPRSISPSVESTTDAEVPKPRKNSSAFLDVPNSSHAPPSPSMGLTSDKGKSKITGKTLTGWL